VVTAAKLWRSEGSYVQQRETARARGPRAGKNAREGFLAVIQSQIPNLFSYLKKTNVHATMPHTQISRYS
jgi:hypothetical protein